MIGCLVLCWVVAAEAQNAASHAAPAPAAPAVAAPVSALQKQRDDLQTAIVKDDLARLAAFIRSGMKLDFNFDDEAPRQRTGESPLTMAVNRNKVEIVRMLLDAGASPTRLDGFGRAPIHLAKSPEVARLLARGGIDPNALNHRGYTGLMEAVQGGDLGQVDALLAGGARFDAPSKGPDVFTIAVQVRKTDLIPALLERGADPRRPPTQALGPLIDAGDTERAVLLIRRGADPNSKYRDKTALMVGIERGGAFGDVVFDAGGRVEYAVVIPAEVPGAAAMPVSMGLSGSTEPPYFNYRGVNTGMSVGPLTWTVLRGRGDLAVRMLARDRKVEVRSWIFFAAGSARSLLTADPDR